MLYDIRLHNVFFTRVLGNQREKEFFFVVVVGMNCLEYSLAESDEISHIFRPGNLFALEVDCIQVPDHDVVR
jgi:hypothetical protein